MKNDKLNQKDDQWECKYFDELTVNELYKILAIRTEVFIVEQNCPYQDVDGKDKNSFHLWSINPENKEITSYCRIVKPGISYNEPSIGRVLTKDYSRRTGLGKRLMEKSIEEIEKIFPGSGIRISAQLYLEKFYQSFGFVTLGESYMEDNIPHVQMLKVKS